jgi:Zn-dependent peptidase ImmA (M78 family)
MGKISSNRDLEREANIFAVCLLIPRDLILAEMRRQPLDWTDDTRFNELCRLFDVSKNCYGF